MIEFPLRLLVGWSVVVGDSVGRSINTQVGEPEECSNVVWRLLPYVHELTRLPPEEGEG